jgi:hypothetical protein
MDIPSLKPVNEEDANRIESAMLEEDGMKRLARIEKESALSANSLILLEAATGFEPVNNGFADRCLSHLAMPPKTSKQYEVSSRSTCSRP